MNKNTTIPTNFELEMQAAMAVPDASPQFVAVLKNQLIDEAQNLAPHSGTMPNNYRHRLAWSIPLVLFALLTITTLLIGPQKVWAAVQRMFGYLPGVGYVHTDGSILVLAEPVMIEREGIQVTVEQVVADSERTVVLYKVEGLSLQEANSQGENAQTGSRELLSLPDGTILTPEGGTLQGWAIGYNMRMIFPALPENTQTLTFIIPRLQTMPAGVTPENWEIPLSLSAAAGEVDLLPIEVPIQPTEISPATAPTGQNSQSEIAFTLDRVIELEDGFQFEGTVNWLGDSELDLSYLGDIQITDANGDRVPSEQVQPDEIFNTQEQNQSAWAQRTVGKAAPGPWTLKLNQLMVRTEPQIAFQVDFGKNPQPGQIWEVDHTFELQTLSLTLHTITLENSDREEYQLVYHFTSDTDLSNIFVTDQDWDAMGGSSGGIPQEQGISVFTAYKTLPTGMRQLTLATINYVYAGEWQITWQPPESAAGADPIISPTGETCLTFDIWEQLNAQPPALLGEIGGKLLLKTHTGLRLPEISLTAIDGAQSQVYGIGAWISLSPDGTMIANPDEDGIHLVDTATGESTLIPNTLGGEYPVWSPDGSEIAFWDWAQASIYRIKLDGSGLTKVYQGSDMIYLAGWSGASNQLIYLGFASDGPAINGINLGDGSIEMLIQTGIRKPNHRPVLSPDGEWLLYKAAIEGDTVNGIFITRLDGSEKHLLVAEDSESRYVPVGGAWSPDGSWVAVNILDYSNGYVTNPVPYLVNPTSCEVIPLLDLSGEAAGWAQ